MFYKKGKIEDIHEGQPNSESMTQSAKSSTPSETSIREDMISEIHSAGEDGEDGEDDKIPVNNLSSIGQSEMDQEGIDGLAVPPESIEYTNSKTSDICNHDIKVMKYVDSEPEITEDEAIQQGNLSERSPQNLNPVSLFSVRMEQPSQSLHLVVPDLTHNINL